MVPRRWIAGVLVLLTLAVYAPVRNHEFINYDDSAYVTANPMVQRGLTGEGFIWAFTTYHICNWHPLTWLSHMLDCTLFGINPAGPHLVNVMLHVINAVLVFLLFHRLTGALWRSALVAALFAWHPLHVESVAWVSERKDLLSTLLGLLALLAYHRHATGAGKRWYWLSLTAFGLSLLAKPMFVTLPCVMLLLDYWPLGRLFPAAAEVPANGAPSAPDRGGRSPLGWRGLLVEKIPFLLGSLALSVVTLLAQKAGGAVVAVEFFSVPNRIANAVFGYAGYLAKTFWPTNLICPYFERHWTTGSFALALGGLLAVTGLVVALRGRKYLTVGWCWYLGTLVPVIGLVQVGNQPMADRYTYFPLLGIFVMVLWGGGELLSRFRQVVRPAVATVTVVLAGCLLLTAQQVRHWENSVSLFSHTLSVEPRNYVAENRLGDGLLTQGNLPEAITHLSKAVEINPADPDAVFGLGAALASAGRPVEAIGWYQQNLITHPDHPNTLSGLADVLANQGRTNEALAAYQKRLALKPELGPDHAGFAALLARMGRTAEAETHFRAGLRLEPASSLSHYNLAVFLSSQNRVTEADEHFARAAGMEPAIFQIHLQWAVHLIRTQRPTEAVAQLRKAVRLFEESAPLCDLLARVLAAHPDDRLRNGTQAMELAEKACRLTEGKHPGYLDTLAASQAEAGRFSQAVATLQRALQLTTSERSAALRSGLQSRLERYQRSTPLRDANEWILAN